MEIKQVTRGGKGFFIATENDSEAGVMTFTPAEPGKIIIDHTEVNPAFSGKGIGRKLLDAAVQYARENKIKIIPLCTYAKSVFDKDPSINDVYLFNQISHMKKPKPKKEKLSEKKKESPTPPGEKEKPFDFGGLPERDLKKNLGCG